MKNLHLRDRKRFIQKHMQYQNCVKNTLAENKSSDVAV